MPYCFSFSSLCQFNSPLINIIHSIRQENLWLPHAKLQVQVDIVLGWILTLVEQVKPAVGLQILSSVSLELHLYVLRFLHPFLSSPTRYHLPCSVWDHSLWAVGVLWPMSVSNVALTSINKSAYTLGIKEYHVWAHAMSKQVILSLSGWTRGLSYTYQWYV